MSVKCDNQILMYIVKGEIELTRFVEEIFIRDCTFGFYIWDNYTTIICMESIPY